MRKILLASTALVALTSVSAMAADVTISGSASLIYLIMTIKMSQQLVTDLVQQSASMSSETDVNISFSNTTDSGITATLNAGLMKRQTTLTTQQQPLFLAISEQSKSFVDGALTKLCC